MKYLLTLFIACVLVNKADACFCFAPDIKKDFERSDIVFEGKVISMKIDSNIYFSNGEHPYLYTFLVEKKWKGHPRAFTHLISIGDCDKGFWPDSTYIVFASGESIYTSRCTHSTFKSFADKELIDFLGEGEKVYLPADLNEKLRYLKDGPIKTQIVKNEPKVEFPYKYLIAVFIGLVILIITFYLGRLSQKP